MEARFSATRHRAEVAPSGELDVTNVEQLRRALLHACEADEMVVLDLTDVAFLDSSVLGVVVAAARRMREKGGDLEVVHARGAALRAIRLTGLMSFLNVREE